MSSQAPSVAVAAGIVTMLVVAGVVIQGLVLDVESPLVGLAMGVLAGLGVGAIALLATVDRRTPDLQRHLGTATGLFAWIALLLLLGLSEADIATNMISLVVGIVVGAVVGGGAYVWLRQQNSQQVTAL